MKQNLFFVILLVLVSVVNATEEDCKKKSGGDCEPCLDISGCAYCANNKQCFFVEFTKERPCGIDDLKEKTCVGSYSFVSFDNPHRSILANAKTWIIVFGSVGGVALIAIIVVIILCRRRCKRRAAAK
jgi:hypothetical protein